MANILINTELCNYIISKQQTDLLIIFEKFADKVRNPESNIFFLQNEVLDKILVNIENCKRSVISSTGLYKGLNEEEKEIIETLDLDRRILHDYKYSKILGIDYFDDEKFIFCLDEHLNKIATKYNLNANDDYNKLYNFLYSLKLNLSTSDDMLATFSNQYTFYKEHSNKLSKESEQEYISIYGVKYYKFDILKELINDYSKTLNSKTKTKSR